MHCNASKGLASPNAKRTALALMAIAGMVLLLGLPLFSQSSNGRILGTVTDQSGGAVVGASVTVTNVATGVARNLTTDNVGEYNAPNLVPGSYAVHVTSKGFKTVDRRDILLEVAKEIRIDVQLSPGEVSQTVEVTGAAPMVDTTSVTLGGTLSNDTINDLPLNGRNYINLLSLRPGVEQYPGGGAWTQASDGLRVEDQNWVMDGLDNNETMQGQPVINSPGTAGDSATIIPIDAIQEFNVEENPKAEFGWRPGAVVNVGLKSGTNNVHGTLYGFGRSDAWDARNYFDPAPNPKPPLNLEQWGGTVGGPIKKDKLFYFAGFEEQRYEVGNSTQVTLPSSVAGAGPTTSIPDAEAQLATNGVPLSALSLKLLPLLTPTSDPAGNAVENFLATNKSDNVLSKIDYTLNSHNTLSGSYFLGNDNNVSQDAPVTEPQFLSTFKIRTQALSTHWVYTPNSRWVNEARFGWVRYNRPVQPVDHSVPPTQYGINTGVTNPLEFGMPTLQIRGFPFVGAFPVWPNLLGPDNNFDWLDQVSYLRGKHFFKFGGEFRYGRVLSEAFSNGRGRFNFTKSQAFLGSTALEDFLAGKPSVSFNVVGNPVRNYRQKSYAWFVQDDYRIRQRITLNLGLRWEYTGPVSETNNLLANFDPNSPTGMVQVGQNGLSSPYNRQKTNFAPRFGVAWDVTGKGTTVVRAGGSLFYDMLPLSVFTDMAPNLQNAHTPGIGKTPTGALLVRPDGSTLQGTGTIATAAFKYPSSALNWSLAGPVFPSSAQIKCGSGGATGNPCSIFSITPNFQTPYVETWTLSIQHSFTPGLSLEVAYIGNHGDNLSGAVDINSINPQSPGELDPACNHCEANANRPYASKFPWLAFINQIQNPYISNYHGLQATLTGRHFHNMSFVAGYTYAHALDDMSFSILNFTPQDNNNPTAGQYSNSDFDIRNRFTLSYTYDVPGIKTPAQLLQGWHLNAILTLSGAAPWWAFDTGNDISATGELMDRWDFFGNPSDFKSGSTPLPCYGFGALPGTPAGIGTCGGTIPAACMTAAQQVGPGAVTQLGNLGCYMKGNSVMIPPALGTFGTLSRNVFRDSGFKNLDFSFSKDIKFGERVTSQFRAEFFNVLNHPNFGNPYTSINGVGVGDTADPSSPGRFGCGCFTPDQAATNPVLGSGGARAIQLGMKFLF